MQASTSVPPDTRHDLSDHLIDLLLSEVGITDATCGATFRNQPVQLRINQVDDQCTFGVLVYWRTVVLYVGQVEKPRCQCERCTMFVGVDRTSIRSVADTEKSTNRSGVSDRVKPRMLISWSMDAIRRELSGVLTPPERSVPKGW